MRNLKILSDYKIIEHRFGREFDKLRIYPLGDVHVGSSEFDEKEFEKWIRMVKNDEYAKVVIVGDLLDNALRNSKTNIFEATKTPFEQELYLVEKLTPIKDKILGAVRGNHEYRSTDANGTCHIYNIMRELGINDLYRENMGFIRLVFGKNGGSSQHTYRICLFHGGSENRVRQFSYSLDNVDLVVSGHTHRPSSNFPSKIRFPMVKDEVYLETFAQITVPSYAKFGGYAMRGLYLPQGLKTPVAELKGIVEKGVKIEWI